MSPEDSGMTARQAAERRLLAAKSVLEDVNAHAPADEPPSSGQRPDRAHFLYETPGLRVERKGDRIVVQLSTAQPLRAKVFAYQNEDGSFTAQVPAIPGCVSEGETWDDLLANLREAVQGCLLSTPGDYEPLDETGREMEVEL